MRVVPDVSADADPYTGIALGRSTLQHGRYVFSMGSIGGASLACPTMAGIEADAQQAAGGRSGSPTRPSTRRRAPWCSTTSPAIRWSWPTRR